MPYIVLFLDEMRKLRTNVNVNFIKVVLHIGDEFNGIADQHTKKTVT